jgi:hypothetical protein
MKVGSLYAVEMWVLNFGVLANKFESKKLLGDSMHLRQEFIRFYVSVGVAACLYVCVKMCSPYKGHPVFCFSLTDCSPDIYSQL